MKDFVILFLLLPSLLSAQIQLHGEVCSRQTKQEIPFVNIGIRHKNIGTCSSANGAFTLFIPAIHQNDSLTFYSIGYEELTIPLNSLNQKQEIFFLNERSYALREVNISTSGFTEKKYGIKKYNPVFHIVDASMNHNDIFEIAQLIRLPNKQTKITSVNLFINASIKDSATFRINFYSYDGKKPQQSLLQQNIIVTKKITEGWLSFNLSGYNIRLSGNVVAAIEFIPGKQPVKYDVKLGGTTRSFSRSSSMGQWQTPPHHYRLFVTALTAPGENSVPDHEEDENPPTARFFSSTIKDTFSVFVNLPKVYKANPGKKYPVVYVLDANVYFDLLAHELRHKDIILVGIGYSNAYLADSLRNRDYTFPEALKTDSMPLSGGAEKFLQFIQQDVISYTEKHYRVQATNNTLMGHSLGGYFVLYALLKDLENGKQLSFSHYISASPSLEYCNYYLLDAFKKLSCDHNALKTLYITMGSKETESLPGFYSFLKLLESKSLNCLEEKNDLLQGMHHMETAVPSFTKTIK